MQIVGAGLHRDVEDTATCLPEFRGVVAGLNRNFLDHVNAGLTLRWYAGSARIRCILTFHPERLRIGRSAIEADQAVGGPRGSGNQLHHGVGIPNTGASRQSAANTQYW